MGEKGGKAEEAGPVGFYAQNRQCSEKNNNGKGRDERRKPPVSQGIINLCPSHSRTSSTLVFAKFRWTQFPKMFAKRKRVRLSRRSYLENHLFRSLSSFLYRVLFNRNLFLA